MMKEKDILEMESYLEKNASKLVKAKDEDIGSFVKAAKKDLAERKRRAAKLRRIRKEELRLTQKDLAIAVGANLRTLQSWERGRQEFPKSVEILMKLMKELPTVKKKLLPKSKVA